MEAQFWHERWQTADIAFHEPQPNTFLVRWLHQLGLTQGDTVLVPLCGKTMDIGWLLEQGFKVIGVELSSIAVEQLFESLGMKPKIEPHGKFIKYEAGDLIVLQGDIFYLGENDLVAVNAIYDRAALVALTSSQRHDYSCLLQFICPQAKQLVLTYEYDQSCYPGPPFSIDEERLAELYGQAYVLKKLLDEPVPNGLKQTIPATAVAWLLIPRSLFTEL